MPDIAIRDAVPDDFSFIVACNAIAEVHTSAMDVDRLAMLSDLAWYFRVITVNGDSAGFLLAMRENAHYQNDNFAFFASRFDRFLYIDRIVISPNFAGLKLGSLFYQDLFQLAKTASVPHIVCEYNIQPPNEPSRRFHDKFGFKQLDTQWLDGGRKQVSLQSVEID